MAAFSPESPFAPLRLARLARLWRTLFLAVAPIALLGQSTTTFELPLERAGHRFSLTQSGGSFANGPLTLEITDLEADGVGGFRPTALSRLLATTALSLTNDYFLTDDSTGEVTPANRLADATFLRRSFLDGAWLTGSAPSTNFFVSLPESRAGHQFSIVSADTSFSLTTSPVLSFAEDDGSGQTVLRSYGFFEGWSSIGPAPGPTSTYLVIDQSASERSGDLPATTRDLLHVTWEPLTYTPLPSTGAVDLVLSADNLNEHLILHTPGGFVQSLLPKLAADGSVHATAALGLNQQFWVTRVSDGAVSPNVYLGVGLSEMSFDLTSAFPSSPGTEPEAVNTSGDIVYLKIPASRWDHSLEIRDINGAFVGMVEADHMQGFWSNDGNWKTWFTSYYYLDATAPSAGQGWYVHDNVTDEDSVSNPSDLTQWASPDANLDSDGDGLLDWYERLIGTGPYSTDSDGDGLADNVELSIGTDPRNWDTDGDGLPDGWEVANGFSPLMAGDDSQDLDLDGLSNLDEYRLGTDPNNWDTDGDGLSDGWEIRYGLDPRNPADANADPDQDGLTNHEEYAHGTDPFNADTDGDGLPDGWEVLHGLNPLDSSDANGDADGDGLSNLQEYLLGTDPQNWDTDGDGMSDGWEIAHAYNPFDPNDGSGDDDGDGLTNAQEFQHGTDPRQWDTDGDGLPDGWEVAHGLNPLDSSDAGADFDGDGLTNYEEYFYGTDPQNPDTDGDGMPDRWEVIHGFNPVDPADAQSDPDGDGLTNLEEFQLHTDPVNSDTDGDGMSDAWELAHGGDPLTYGIWHTFRIAAGRVGHHFSRTCMGSSLEWTPTLQYQDGASFGEGMIEFPAGGGTLNDDTAGDHLDISDWAQGFLDVTLGADWKDAQGAPSARQYFLLPASMAGDVVVLYASTPDGGVIYPVTSIAYPSYLPQSYSNGQPANPGDISEGSATFALGAEYCLIDLTTNQKSVAYHTNLLENEWVGNDIPLPIRSISIAVSAADAGRRFTVISNGASVGSMVAPWTDASTPFPIITAAVVNGLPFTLIREDDYVSGTTTADADTFDFTTFFPGDANPAPVPPNYQLTTFQVGAEYTGLGGYYQDDGSYIPVWTDGSSGQFNYWDGTGQALTYTYLIYTASVDFNRPFYFQDSTGSTNFMNFAPWTPMGAQNTLAVSIVASRSTHDIVIYDSNGNSSPLQYAPGYQGLFYNFTADAFIFPGLADGGDLSYNIPYAAAVVPLDPTLALTAYDNTTGESLTFGPDSQRTSLNLSRWDNFINSAYLTISATRIGHTLEIHTVTGQEFDLTAQTMQGFWTPGSPVDLVQFSTTWTYLATGTIPADLDWWVYDRTTNEVAPRNTQDLTLWAAADKAMDNDGDGLPDWFERALGLNPQSVDSDGDGLPDGWEITHGLNPLDLSDANADPDGDGLTNAQEYQLGTDPQNWDTDGDSMPDSWEIAHGLNPFYAGDAYDDWDGDGLLNWQEYQHSTDPSNADTDGDGILDGVEVAYGLNPLDPSDADADWDIDGLSNRDEIANRTNPWNYDTDGDGLPDGWEVFHRLNPLDAADADGDADGDGLTNRQEYAYGTDPQNVDTDGDGVNDGWELAHGANPLVAGKWHLVRISAGRVGHHFTLLQAGTECEWLPTLVYNGGNSWNAWAEASVELTADSETITDDTTGDILNLVNDALNVVDATQEAGWTTPQGQPVTRQYFLLPSSMANDVLVLYSGVPGTGVVYPATTIPYPGTRPQPYSNGQPTNPWDLCEASAAYSPGTEYRLIDLSTDQRSTDDANNLLEGGWGGNDIVLPLRSVTVKLPVSDAGRRFTIISGLRVDSMAASWTDEQNPIPTFATAVLDGCPFTVIREDDRAQAFAVADADTIDLTTALPVDPYGTPIQPKFQWIYFSAGTDHQGIGVYTIDQRYDPSTDGSGGQFNYWDADGQSHNYSYLNYTAWVDTNQYYYIVDSAGSSDLMSLAPWTPPGAANTLAVSLIASRAAHNLTFVDSNGSTTSLQYQPGYEGLIFYYSGSNYIFPGLGDQQFLDFNIPYVAAVVPLDPTLGFTVYDNDTAESQTFPADPARTSVDLSRWQRIIPACFTISATRRGHALEVHTSSGRSFPLTLRTPQGYWSPGTPADPAQFVNTWSFVATGSISLDEDWWIYDCNTNEIAPTNTRGLTTWLAGDRDTDSDGDGLPDWFELTLGLNPAKRDTDRDGMSDGDEIAAGRNPLVAETSLTIKVEAGRAYHHFSLGNPTGPALLSQMVGGTTASYTLITALLNTSLLGTEASKLYDQASGEYLWLSENQQDYTNEIWISSVAPRRYFLIPASRRTHALWLYCPVSGSTYPVTVTPMGPGSGTGGNVVEVSASFSPNESFQLVDLTTYESGPLGETGLVPGNWTPNTTALPFIPVTIIVPDGDAGFYFRVSSGGTATTYRALWDWVNGQQHPTLSLSLHALSAFTVTREIDSASLSDQMDTHTGDIFDYSTKFPVYSFDGQEDIPDWQTVYFTVDETHWGSFNVAQTANYWAPVTEPANNVFSRVCYDYLGAVYYTYHWKLFSARIDARKNYVVIPTYSGLPMDGFHPPTPPTPLTGFGYVQVGQNHWNQAIRVHPRTGPAVVIQPDWSTMSYHVARRGDEDIYYYYYVYYKIPGNLGVILSIDDDQGHTNLMDGFNPPAPPVPIILDTIHFRVGQNHWNDVITAIQPDGSRWPAKPIANEFADFGGTLASGYLAPPVDANGAQTRYYYRDYSVRVSPGQTYALTNLLGQSNFLDGFAPAAPASPGVNVAMTTTRAGHALRIVKVENGVEDPNATAQITVTNNAPQ